ncbi:unnamed protein product [[Actinomadura] parvosata subsp. kistnae]|uniref:Uncharacterized protein n=1 Tax=[Actinomadura] parvosata subsp. kistnae TaxID=1909395 RepID=A0A1V0AAT3_9ACTN|nr:hypothetical protein [Nonomuraea sp. ATCC 55076]AQZ67315.1 hypothetical protein BKM31_42910 [Nonomuraea sp. ATCC 55076]SPL94455.1 unnamed protein product [Actinomadura parvosata subsp. kistnae]
MSEPQPTPADQWSTWETNPELPGYWPGLGLEQAGGFEIHRAGVRSVAGGLVKLAVHAGDFAFSDATHYDLAGLRWNLPRELHAILTDADRAVASFWSDLYAETGMAGLLIERAAANYRLADQPLLGDLPLDRLHERVEELHPDGRGVRGPSELYPNGRVSLRLSRMGDHGVGDMTADQAKLDIEALVRYGGVRDPHDYERMAEALVELANKLQLRAQDLRDAPWHGAAADNAQTALRQIYGNATALAAVTGALAGASRRFAEIVDWCRRNFEAMADPDRGGWEEFWDLGGTADSRARSFLAQANDAFMAVYDLVPEQVQESLPGLLVTDESHTELKWRLQDVQARILDSGVGSMDDPYVRDLDLKVAAYERAEKAYG